MVWEGQERRPNCAEHDADRVGTVHSLDGEPENGQDGARDDGNVGAPETPGGARKHREGSMVWFRSTCIAFGGQSCSVRMTPMAPLRAMTIEMMKKARATMPIDSRHESPTDRIPAANCQVAALTCCQVWSFGWWSWSYLKASETQ